MKRRKNDFIKALKPLDDPSGIFIMHSIFFFKEQSQMIGSTPARDAFVCLFVTFLIISHSSVQHVSSLLQEHKFVNLNKINKVPVSKGLTFPQGK